MISIGANGEKIAYGIKHYNLDTEEDLQQLPAHRNVMGATAFVISTSKYYMLNSNLKWVEISPFGKSVSSGDSGEGDTDHEDIVYEGGII